MIAIKGSTTMPKSCWNCNFCLNKDGYYCAISSDFLADEVVDIPDENRPNNCPLVEIVTCKDCKYYRVEDDDEYCTNHTFKDNKFWVREDYFCADGERRE